MKNTTDKLHCIYCSSKNLILNIWGYPNTEELKKLESKGYGVNIMGCIPPEVGEESFLYECRDCGRKFGDYEDEY